VKTSILLIDNEVAKQKTEIAFVKISADGFDLGATKRPVAQNDLPDALELLHAFADGKTPETPLVTLVNKDRILAKSDYSLSGDRYKTGVDYQNTIWPKVQLGTVAEVISGQSPEGKFYNDFREGMAFYQGKTEFGETYLGNPKKWTTQITKVAQPGDILMSVRAPVGPVNITLNEICIGRGIAAIRSVGANQKYLFHILKSMESIITGGGGAVFDSISRTQIEEIEIPLPPLEVQEQIVDEIEFEETQIDSAKKLIETYEARIKAVIAKLWSE
jgi:hypothetical protein